MKIIKPSVEFFGAVPTEYNAALKFIEMSGRTCYKSEDKITEDSAEGFVQKLIKAGHLAMVEHSNFVVRHRDHDNAAMTKAMIAAGKFLTVRRDSNYLYVGGNLTAWYQRELGMDETLFEPFLRQYGVLFGVGDEFDTAFDAAAEPSFGWTVCPHDEIPKQLHRYSAKFICDRGVSHELVRHRPCSFAQESTRYVKYGSKDMEFIEPDGFEGWIFYAKEIFLDLCITCAQSYVKLISQGLKPQQARAVLPNALKTEIVVTADAAEWAHIRKLRTAKSAHPDIQRVMNMMPWEEFL